MSTHRILFTLLCGLSAPVLAQSNVTVYGILDAGITAARPGSGAGTVKQVDSGIGYGSRLGFKGSEDLGGGLSANFLMEAGIAVDTGAAQQGGLAWGRQVFVGLTARNWSVTAGRQYSPMWLSHTFSDAFGQTYWGNSQSTLLASASPASVPGDGGYGALSRVNNSVILSAFTGPWLGRVMLAAGEENSLGGGRLVNPSLTYQSGPVGLTASFAHLRQYNKDLPAGAQPHWQNAWQVGGYYDFGPAKVFGSYYVYDPSEANVTLRSTTALKIKAYWVGAQVPIGLGKVITQLTSTRQDRIPGVAQGKATTFGIAYEYALSKRSFLYTAYGQVNNNGTSAVSLYGATASIAPRAIGDDPKALSVGMRHNF